MIKSIQLLNLGTPNKNKISVITDKGKFDLFFSYRTLVGFYYVYSPPEWEGDDERNYHKSRTLQNYWSTTTGKLLNELEPNHKKRIKQEQFDNEVAEMFGFINA